VQHVPGLKSSLILDQNSNPIRIGGQVYGLCQI